MKVAKQKSQELARLAALVRQMKVGMLTTVEADGSLRSRPLETCEVYWDAPGNENVKLGTLAERRTA